MRDKKINILGFLYTFPSVLLPASDSTLDKKQSHPNSEKEYLMFYML